MHNEAEREDGRELPSENPGDTNEEYTQHDDRSHQLVCTDPDCQRHGPHRARQARSESRLLHTERHRGQDQAPQEQPAQLVRDNHNRWRCLEKFDRHIRSSMKLFFF